MISFHFQKSSTAAIIIVGCLATSQTLLAATTVTYTASGTFSLISGQDLFELKNEPFSMAVVASEGMVPIASTTSYAEYKGVQLKATVQSGLEPAPLTVSNSTTGLVLITGSPTYDYFWVGSGLKVVGKSIGILAKITMGKGTLTNDTILPFTHGVQLTPTNATLTYSYAQPDGSTQETTLGITGTLITKVTASAAAKTNSMPMLHGSGVQAVTVHGDGTRSVGAINQALVNSGTAMDRVLLRLFASGVRDATDVHVHIAGQSVRVLYAGPAEQFAGLDEVLIELPPSLAGATDADVRLEADGQTAEPIRVHIQ